MVQNSMPRKPWILFIRKPGPLGIALILVLVMLGGFRLVQTVASSLQDKVIVIDPGHGGADPGAQYGNLREKDVNLAVALRLKQVLEKQGYKVILTRESDTDFYPDHFIKGRTAKRHELNQRIQMATANQADLFISIHSNSFPQRNSYGAESYYHIKSAPGKALAERIQKRLGTLQPDNRRSAKAGDYYLINQTKMPAVIVEVGFISNAKERTLLQTEKYQTSIAEAIGSGIQDFFFDYPLGFPDSAAPALANTDQPPHITSNQFKLYFPSENLDMLAVEARQVDFSAWQTFSLSQRIQYLLQELLKGPKLNSKASPTLAPATKVLGTEFNHGIATVNFSGSLRRDFPQGAIEEELTVESVVWTLSQIEGVEGVRFLIDGQFGDSIAGHVILNQTFTPKPIQGKAAIVIDDFGINNPGTNEMLALNIPFTAAVMPNMMFSQEEAELIHQKGYEIILHMPMEAKKANPEWLGPGALLTRLGPSQAKERLIQGLQTVPYAIGISNHMGSKGTEDPNLVQAIIEVAKERDLLILDSKTSEKSILAKEAHQAQIASGMRDIFLDNANDLGSIKKQLKALIQKAKTSGKAIGIGHVGPQGPNTARAIREMLPEFEAQGIQLVPLSELLQN